MSKCVKIINIPILDKFNVSMYTEKLNELEKRFIAYWIFTYGYIRFLFGITIMHNNSNIIGNKNGKLIVTLTYIIEAVVIANESIVHNRIRFNTASAVITFCLLSLHI